jgi:CDP-6-deoxy-D-xylo-4-hexulose-3-dehydrase
LKVLVESFRDWGRDCWCAPGKDGTCGKRFAWKLGDLPEGYDHKYTYSHLGYNLKLTDMQAAVGVAQMKKLPGFIEARKGNFARLMEGVKPLEEYFVLPRATERSDPSWFGFLLTVKPSAPFTRNALVKFLDERKIGTRLLFAGNMARQPALKGTGYRKVGDLAVTDRVMEGTFWVGVYPGLCREQLDYIIRSLGDCCGEKGRL